MTVGGSSTSKTMESVAKQQFLSSIKQWTELFLEDQLKYTLYIDNIKEDAQSYLKRVGKPIFFLSNEESEDSDDSSSEGSSSEMEF